MANQTKSMKKFSQVIIHGGVFHLDEVMAIVLLKIAEREFDILRTRNIPENTEDSLILDLGQKVDPENGWLDHHQKDGEVRENSGIKYSAVGLMWKYFGEELCERFFSLYFRSHPAKVEWPSASYSSVHIEKFYDWFDSHIILGIDARDNGQDSLTGCGPIDLGSLVTSMNPSDPTKSNQRFHETVELVYSFMKNLIYNRIEAILNESKIIDAFEKAASINAPYCFIPCAGPWKELVQTDDKLWEKTKNIAIAYFKKDGNFGVSVMPGDRESRTSIRVNLNKIDVSGIKESIVFLHPAGFFGTVKTAEAAKVIALKAMEQLQK